QVLSLGACLLLFIGILAEETLRLPGAPLLQYLKTHARDYGPLAVRAGLAVTLGLSAVGGLPRHGTALWSEPTLFVPDMVLSTLPDWSWLAGAELILSLLLLLGLATRLVAVAILALTVLGCVIFGQVFALHYAGHFMAPAILLCFYGAGKYGLDKLLPDDVSIETRLPDEGFFWGVAQLLTGLTFVSLAISVKLAQPTLLIAILEHARFDFFGMPLPLVAVIMSFVELQAGILLAIGRLVRPVALFLLCAFTFFAVVLRESPALHGNLYGLMFICLLHGGCPLKVSISWGGKSDTKLHEEV
ncbi:MAG: hypothetical protein K5905_23270, partial [Roseibium sp.]|uniref:hypothetical protein n=1 Tax=Roseibium sp. TaxID=1936156 RepID=UPI002620D8DC